MLMKKIKSLSKYIPLEIFISLISIAFHFIIVVSADRVRELIDSQAFEIAVMMLMYIGNPAIYILLWSKLIKYKSDKPKSLWRFAVEWTLGVSYVAFLWLQNTFVRNQFIGYIAIPENFIGKLWLYCNFCFSGGLGIVLFPTVYIITGVIFIRMCIRKIKEHYRETGELW